MSYLASLKLNVRDCDSGAILASNNRISLVEVAPKSLGAARAKFDIYSPNTSGNEVECNALNDSKVGVLEVALKERDSLFQVKGIISLEIFPEYQLKGLGKSVVLSISETSDHDLEIIDVNPGAVDFWGKCGVNAWGCKKANSGQSDDELGTINRFSSLNGIIKKSSKVILTSSKKMELLYG